MPNRRQDVPVDASVRIDCVRCDAADVYAYVAYGIPDYIECRFGCHLKYSADERAEMEERAKDAATDALHELEFSHLYLCGADR
jgi:hypothetical protein